MTVLMVRSEKFLWDERMKDYFSSSTETSFDEMSSDETLRVMRIFEWNEMWLFFFMIWKWEMSILMEWDIEISYDEHDLVKWDSKASIKGVKVKFE